MSRDFHELTKKNIGVPRPFLIGQYNQHMGGVDLMDEAINNYRIGVRGKKWYWPIFTWLIDACLANAWHLHRKGHKDVTQLQYRREIAQAWLIKFGTAKKVGGRPATSISSLSCNRVSDDIRYDGRDHFVVMTLENKRRHCAGDGCSSSGRTMCEKCNVGLCVDCFKIFHSITY